MKRGKYAAIGYVVSKLVLPVLKRQMKKKVRTTTANTAKASAGAVKGNPVKTSLAVGSAVGAVSYLLKRRKGSVDGVDPRDVTGDAPAEQATGRRFLHRR